MTISLHPPTGHASYILAKRNGIRELFPSGFVPVLIPTDAASHPPSEVADRANRGP